MAKKTNPFSEYPSWTEARFFGFLRSGLRTTSTKWPPRYGVLNAARRKSESDNKRLKWEFKCAICKQFFSQKEVSVDHIVPCGSLKSFEDVGEFCRRLFVGEQGMQCVCHSCHAIKTKGDLNEMAERNS